jgi:23S rRNA pseudouridine1911/1915/1917 synthase
MTDPKTNDFIISSSSLPEGVDDDDQEITDAAIGASTVELRHAAVPIAGHAQRLDVVLVSLAQEFSRSYLQQLIVNGGVQVNGSTLTKTAARVKAGDSISIELRPTPQSQAFKAEAMQLEVVFEDEYLLVINKPAGLVVHPAPGNWSGTLLNGLLARDPQAAFLPRAGIVHRLDKDTSGLMVVARQRSIMDKLVEMIAVRNVSRNYLAVAHNTWQGSKTKKAEFPVGRDPKNRLRMAVVDLLKHPGKTASTDITLLQNEQEYCVVSCKLHTGRTHQIRVHMAALGHPLVADELYGGRIALGMQRQALHAFKLCFRHPSTQLEMEFKAPLPSDLNSALDALGVRYNETG